MPGALDTPPPPAFPIHTPWAAQATPTCLTLPSASALRWPHRTMYVTALRSRQWRRRDRLARSCPGKNGENKGLPQFASAACRTWRTRGCRPPCPVPPGATGPTQDPIIKATLVALIVLLRTPSCSPKVRCA
ncbi:hypothetical protein GQ53DRAFT_425943 [Thozetella sp. PMI_491]|nr:hypothetical protein GQ53DRAFT_425943 [Thozetella sp. PMI_491]